MQPTHSFGTPIFDFYFTITYSLLHELEITNQCKWVNDVCFSLFLIEFFCCNQVYIEFKEEAERKIRGLEENLASQLNQVLCQKKEIR